MKAVKIEWIDSCTSNQNWMLLDELDGDFTPIKMVSYGILVKEMAEYTLIAQNYGSNPPQVCNLMTIPNGCIKSITEIDGTEL